MLRTYQMWQVSYKKILKLSMSEKIKCFETAKEFLYFDIINSFYGIGEVLTNELQ